MAASGFALAHAPSLTADASRAPSSIVLPRRSACWIEVAVSAAATRQRPLTRDVGRRPRSFRRRQVPTLPRRPLGDYPTHTFGIDDVQGAFDLASHPTPGRIKVAVTR